MNIPALFFGALSAALAGLVTVALLTLIVLPWQRKLSTKSAIKQAEELKLKYPESRFEDYLPIIGRLPASKYSDELHERLFGFREVRRVVFEVPVTDDPIPHVDVVESKPPFYRSAEPGRVFLTPQERELMQLVAQGVPYDEIARLLSVDERIVQSMVNDLVTRFSRRRPS
jgi:hypothetical protein